MVSGLRQVHTLVPLVSLLQLAVSCPCIRIPVRIEQRIPADWAWGIGFLMLNCFSCPNIPAMPCIYAGVGFRVYVVDYWVVGHTDLYKQCVGHFSIRVVASSTELLHATPLYTRETRGCPVVYWLRTVHM